jgi:hypothetical protein
MLNIDHSVSKQDAILNNILQRLKQLNPHANEVITQHENRMKPDTKQSFLQKLVISSFGGKTD